jgi:hypothetical protein
LNKNYDIPQKSNDDRCKINWSLYAITGLKMKKNMELKQELTEYIFLCGKPNLKDHEQFNKFLIQEARVDIF